MTKQLPIPPTPKAQVVIYSSPEANRASRLLSVSEGQGRICWWHEDTSLAERRWWRTLRATGHCCTCAEEQNSESVADRVEDGAASTALTASSGQSFFLLVLKGSLQITTSDTQHNTNLQTVHCKLRARIRKMSGNLEPALSTNFSISDKNYSRQEFSTPSNI